MTKWNRNHKDIKKAIQLYNLSRNLSKAFVKTEWDSERIFLEQLEKLHILKIIFTECIHIFNFHMLTMLTYTTVLYILFRV